MYDSLEIRIGQGNWEHPEGFFEYEPLSLRRTTLVLEQEHDYGQDIIFDVWAENTLGLFPRLI